MHYTLYAVKIENKLYIPDIYTMPQMTAIKIRCKRSNFWRQVVDDSATLNILSRSQVKFQIFYTILFLDK